MARKHVHLRVDGIDLSMPIISHMGVNIYRNAVRLDPHMHEGYEFVFALHGQLSYETEGGEVVELRGGQFSFMKPNIIHKGKGGYESPSDFCWIIFDPNQPNAIEGTTLTHPDLKILRSFLDHVSSKVLMVNFTTKMRQMLLRFRSAIVDYCGENPSVMSASLLRSIACEIIFNSLQQLEMVGNTRGQVYGAAAVQYIEDHLFEPISIEDIASHLGFSISHTFILFKEFTGQSPIDFTLRLRIKKSQEFLRLSSKNITEIADHCGFSSSQYFARIFRKYVGMSPKEYRKQF